MTIIVDVLLALICFSATPEEPMQCHNALIGNDTPRGEFIVQQRLTDDKYYGGDVLQFREDEHEIYAIHRVWLGRPEERRERRLASPDARQRRITKGCINVSKEVYAMLVDCCSNSTLIVK